MSDEQTTPLASTARAMEQITDIAHKLFGPIAEQLGLIMGDKASEYRIKNVIRIIQRTEAMLKTAGISPQQIPPRIALPALDAASLENNETLQERWAALLANAANPNMAADVLPCFSEILKQLIPEEAHFLDRVCDHSGGWMIALPEGARPVSEPATIQGEFLASLDRIMVGNLERLGMIRRVLSREPTYVFTDIGRAFVKACRVPEPTGGNVTVP